MVVVHARYHLEAAEFALVTTPYGTTSYTTQGRTYQMFNKDIIISITNILVYIRKYCSVCYECCHIMYTFYEFKYYSSSIAPVSGSFC